MKNPYDATRGFEQALTEYTGAPYAVAVNSCTAALELAVQWCLQNHDAGVLTGNVEIPRYTYVSVPGAIIRAGGRVTWRDEFWKGAYQLKPLPVWDCARRFRWKMYTGGFQCVSFAASKILGAEQGGAILHSNATADAWFRRMRFDGRTEGVEVADDTFTEIGKHMIMLPSVATHLHLRLYHLPKDNPDMPDYPYRDLSTLEIFR